MKKIISVSVWMMLAVVMMLASCVSRGEYRKQERLVDSLQQACDALTKENSAMAGELAGYKCDPAKLLALVRENYQNKDYKALKSNYETLHAFHMETEQYKTAKGIYEQSIKDQAEAKRKAEIAAAKAEAERKAKMKPIERTMEKYDCTAEVARLILQGRVQIGMTAEQCRAAWGRPRDINRSCGTWGVHEQWCYNGSYLYFEDGILRSWQN